MHPTGTSTRTLLHIGLAAVAAIAVVAVLLAVQAAEAEPTYVGSDTCGDCHKKAYASWRDTAHGMDFTEFPYSGHTINKFTYNGGNDTTGMVGNCAPCHLVGYMETDKGGFDPTLPWNSTHNLPLLGIGCEDCHGPGSDHAGADEPSADMINLGMDQYGGSCGGNGFQMCHNDTRQYGNETIPGWSESAHASGVPDYVKRVDCAPCHEVQSIIMAFEGEEVTKLPDDPIWSIECAACHDPHPEEGMEHEMQLRADPEVLCEQCHVTTSAFGSEEVHHPTSQFRGATIGYGAEKTTYMDDVSCYDCHMFTSPRGTPLEDWNNGHSWMPAPQACMECHSMYEDKEMAMEGVEAIQEETEAHLTMLQALHATAMERKAFAEDNGLWTPALNTSYYEAVFNIGIVEGDGSMGFHNPVYAKRLLDAAQIRLDAVIDAIGYGGVSGTIVDADDKPIDGAMIVDESGAVVATTGADGTYFFWTMAGKHTFLVKKDTNVIGHVAGVDVPLMSNATAGTTKMGVHYTTGHVSGTIVDSGEKAVPGATLVDDDGMVVATTGADGSYSFDRMPGKYNFVVKKDGKVVGAVTDVSVTSGGNTTVGSTAVTLETAGGDEDEGGLDGLSIGLIAVIVVLVILLVLMAMRKPKPTKAE